MTLLISLQTRRILFIIFCTTIVGVIVVLTVLQFVGYRPAADTALPIAQDTINTGLPLRLEIPKIAVNAAIDNVGLTMDGDLDVPTGYASVGWYKDGPRPGEPGSAVIDGHFGRSDNGPAAFDNLYQLQKGDKLSVIDVEGITTIFTVTGSRSYDPAADATAVFRSNDSKARLNLITCQGSWDNSQSGYRARLVVFAEKQSL